MHFLTLLAAVADPNEPTPEERMQAYRFGLILIVGIGIVGILLIVAMLAAWRNFHKRIAQLEAERDARREQAGPHTDLWQEAGDRVEVEPSPRDDYQDTDDLDEDELYGKDWEPGDDDDNPDDDKGW
ncbi:hypothetical protein [Algisphaera agarilytica]|uniref:Uncharacterized protein n=1 Tax=Algisphaera agarilytica TaxID=1385975 RepID=A0A7X0H5J0_9BACT|nr:hypothetical protein [Algisphaera agarilytica]MBB6429671.1 hypothetical protein [Algisphaera agarilytica]